MHKVRKQFILDSEKIQQVKKLLQVKTETEAVDKALDLVIANRKIRDVLMEVKGKFDIEDIYGAESR